VHLLDTLKKEKDGIFEWVLKGLIDLERTGHFSETEETIDSLEWFKRQNSPLYEFLLHDFIWMSSPTDAQKEASRVDIDEMYDLYTMYCHKNGYNRKALSQFHSEIEHIAYHDIRISIKKNEQGRTEVFGLRRKVVNQFFSPGSSTSF
jgi:phage/plasmid-associated DNA primase